MRIIATLTGFLWFCSFGFAQNYTISGVPITDCDGFFLDSGGNDAGYQPNESFQTLICPDQTTGTHIELRFSGVELGDGDELCFYDDTDGADDKLLACASDFVPGAPFIIQATAANSSGCLTVTFRSDDSDENLGWSAAINCIPACQTIQSGLVSTTPVAEPLVDGWIDICIGDRVRFEGIGRYLQNNLLYAQSDAQSTFEWNFGDGTFAAGQEVSHVFSAPGGYTVQLSITDQFGCQNTNFLSQRIRVSPKPDFSISDSFDREICQGDTIELTAGVFPAAAVVTVAPKEESFVVDGARVDSLDLPDGDGRVHSTSISFNDFLPGQQLTNINQLKDICLNMEHSWMHDLEVNITCPSGKKVILQNQVSKLNEVFLGQPDETDEELEVPLPGMGSEYCFAPDATNGTWTQYADFNKLEAASLPTGTYSSYENLNQLVGCPLNGDWTLTVIDYWGMDNGWVFSWGISFDKDIYPRIETFQPAVTDFQWTDHPSIVSNTPELLVAVPENAGTANYNLEVTDEYGCVFDTLIDISVLPPTHPDCHSCDDLSANLNDTLICEGDVITLNAGALTEIEASITFETFPGDEFDRANSTKAAPYESELNINSLLPLTIADVRKDLVSVCLDLSSTGPVADLSISLVAPSGEMILLSEGNGGAGQAYQQTCFSPVAATPITAGVAPLTGNFQAEGDWSELNGATINGDWNLQISDCCGNADYNTLHSWSITFNNQNTINYSWENPTSLSCEDCPEPEASPDATVRYQLNIEDSYGCTSGADAEVRVLSMFAAPVVGIKEMEDGTIIFKWSRIPGAPTYEVNIDGAGWIPANGFLEHRVNGLDNGQEVRFEVRASEEATLDCGTGIGMLNAIMCDLEVEILQQDDVSCNGIADGSIRVNAFDVSQPPVYQLDEGSAQMSGNFVDQLTAGEHMITIDGGSGCIDTLRFSVNEPDSLQLFVMVDSVSCFGESDGRIGVQALGGSGNYDFTWFTPTGTFRDNILLNVPAGTYIGSVSDGACPTVEIVTELGSPEPLEIDLTLDPPGCHDGADGQIIAAASGGTGSYQYRWSDGQSTATATGLSAELYTVEVTDANRCRQEVQAELTEPLAFAITLQSTDVSCNGGADGIIEVSTRGGTPFEGNNYEYEWSNGSRGDRISRLAAGLYTVVVTDANGCTTTVEERVGEPDALNLQMSSDAATCAGSSDGTATVLVSGGTSTYEYLWSDIAAQRTSDAFDLPKGVYEVMVTDANNCEATASVEVMEPPAVVIDEIAVSNISCYGLIDGAVEVLSVSNAQGAVDYAWGPHLDDAFGERLEGLASAKYTVTVTDEMGCTAEQSATVIEPPLLTLDFVLREIACHGEESATVVAAPGGGTGAYTYQWAGGETTPLLQNQPAGTYEVMVQDANG
ncbi:MAG: proprotein convertase P-domain-containing protein, partial [Bacteroidota bacterium]